MDTPALVLELVLSSVLLAAATEKMLAPSDWGAARREVAAKVPQAVWNAVPLAEVLVGGALGIGLRPWDGAAAGGIFAAFTFVLFFAYRHGARGDCNCFGALLPMRIGPKAIARAALLMVASILLLVAADWSDPPHLPTLAIPIAAAAVTSLYSSVRKLLSA